MSDNTVLNAGSGGDTIRDVARSAGTVKTQVVQLDIGGAAANAEVLVTAGQQAMAASLPVVIANNQTVLNVTTSVNGFVSTGNSSATILAANGVFTGATEDVTEYGDMRVSIISDQASATDGLQLQQSSNGTNWDILDVYSIPGGQGKTFSAGISCRYVRIVYNNGAVSQGSFRLQTRYYKTYTKGASARPQDGRTNENDFEEALSYGMAFDGTNWNRLRATITYGVLSDVSRIVGALPAGTNRLGMAQLTGGVTSTALGLGSTVTAYGSLRVTAEPIALFTDAFDGTTIDVSRWNSPATVSGMTLAQASGNLTITTTTTASNFAFIDTVPTFAALGLNFMAFGVAVKLEAQVSNLFALNQHRFIGYGDRPASYATTTPHKNSYGFEIDVDGILYCCVYSNGTRIYRTSTSLTGVTLNSLVSPSGGYVRFGMAMRADTLIFYVNSTEYPAASFSVSSATFSMPDTVSLPVRFSAVNAASGTVGASVFSITALGIGDTGNNASQLADGIYPWRRVTVKPGSVAVTATDLALVVGLHPSSALPAGTNSIGTVQQAALTKSTQGATGVTTQDLKDAGRVARIVTIDSYAVAATAETIMPTTLSSDAGTAAVVSPFIVTTGKRFRMQSIVVAMHTITGNTTAVNVIVRIRALAGGSAIVTSPIQFVTAISGIAAANGAVGPFAIPIPDGWELPAASSFVVTVACAGFVATTAAPKVDVSIMGYEY